MGSFMWASSANVLAYSVSDLASDLSQNCDGSEFSPDPPTSMDWTASCGCLNDPSSCATFGEEQFCDLFWAACEDYCYDWCDGNCGPYASCINEFFSDCYFGGGSGQGYCSCFAKRIDCNCCFD